MAERADGGLTVERPAERDAVTSLDDDAEVPLRGGCSTEVVRRGATVRRTASPWTPTVHALLHHLRAAGVHRVPRPLGHDEQGREVLEFVEGTTAWWPWPEPLRSDAGLVAVARLVRELGDALASFEEPPSAVWQGGPRWGEGLVVRHGDFGPWNTVWRDGELVALIDWDTAEPAPPGWDAAQAAWAFVPLRPMTGYRAEAPLVDAEVEHRFGLWCRELALEPARVFQLLEDQSDLERHRLVHLGGAGVEPFAAFLARGDLDELDAEGRWRAEHRDRLVAAAEAVVARRPDGDASGPCRST
ncbi:aminoglycoside phosphotransferase family protein [Streptomyces sp. NP160]|uniref:phosphotransferase n=1 Tax=Streptomyces sp. NP160 TaxID=2586637 RepID=UPI00111AE62A|nr:phosphotransferase [Streptomyces sp. NP160]TNM64540.1 aminoglycoside phosphotransferase family protein [Streptomyces sp. NP160]